jgi:IstB-like ATP binding protein
VRYLGHFLTEDPLDVPWSAVEYVAGQLDIADPSVVKSFGEWGQVFGDEVLATAILDRLASYTTATSSRLTAPATDSRTASPPSTAKPTSPNPSARPSVRNWARQLNSTPTLIVDAGDGDVVACAVGRPVWLVQPARRTTSATVIAGRDTAFIPSSSPVPGYLAMADPASSVYARW